METGNISLSTAGTEQFAVAPKSAEGVGSAAISLDPIVAVAV
jgi:hypothetical protein